MDKKIELSQEQIEEIVDSSNMNLSEKQRNEMIANLKNGKKNPSNLIKKGDIELLQALINDGLDVNEINIFGELLILTAIMFSDLDIVKLLIKNGADVNVVVQDKPLIIYALMFGDIEIVKLLIESGADVNVVVQDKPLIAYALEFGNNELVKLLIESGANIEFKNDSSLLEQALVFSNTEIVELCIEKGSNFSSNILFDVSKAKDGYIFDRKDILNILDKKNKDRTTLSEIEQDLQELIESQESMINFPKKYKNILKENQNSTNTQEQNILIDKEIEKQNNQIIKHSQELNKLHKRLNKIRMNMTNMINKMNDMQDIMTVLTIIDFIKIFIKYGGDVNYIDENGSSALMLLSYFGYEDCVKLLIENGAEIDIQNSGIETPLLLAYENNHFNVVKLLIDSGANVNIIMDNDESFYKKAKYDNKHYEVLEWIENSLTYVKITHNPKELLKILSNFTIDKPIKYTTHTWDFGELKKEYGDFDGYMNSVKNQFDKMKMELEELSPNLYKKIYTFLIDENPDKNYSWCSKTHINIGWSSLEGLREHCDSGNNPFDFKLPKPIFMGRKQLATFGEVINLFKQEIEIRADFKNLEQIFLSQNIQLDLSAAKLNTRQFYTDTQKFSNVLGKIFYDMGNRKDFKNIEVTTTELDDRSIEIKIIQLDSNSTRRAIELLERSKEAGDISDIKIGLTNLCDWSIESSFEDENFRVNFLHSNNVKDIEILETKPKGFTHILRFYK